MTIWEDFKLAAKITGMMIIAWYAASQLAGAAFGAEVNRQNLIGMWAYVSTHNEFPDGRKESWFGPHPIGRFVLMRNGNYSHIIACNPKDKADNLCKMYALIHWGTYTVDRKGTSFTGKVHWGLLVRADGTTSNELTGRQQLRVVTKLTRNDLHYVNHESIAGEDANVVAVLRRIP